MNFTDTKGEWKQIKAYIDSSISEAQNNAALPTLESYLQAQLKPLGLTCNVVALKQNNTYNNYYYVGSNAGRIYVGNSENVSDNFTLYGSGRYTNTYNLIIDTTNRLQSTNSTTLNTTWGKYAIYTNAVYNSNNDCQFTVTFSDVFNNFSKEIVLYSGSSSGINISYTGITSTDDALYLSNKNNLYIIDKQFNVKSVQITTRDQSYTSLYNFGDDGIYCYNANGYNLIYKNGVFVTPHSDTMHYSKGGVWYYLEKSRYKLITDSLAIKYAASPISYSTDGMVSNKSLFEIIDLEKNKIYEIGYPPELFTFSHSNPGCTESTMVPYLVRENIIYLVSVYKP